MFSWKSEGSCTGLCTIIEFIDIVIDARRTRFLAQSSMFALTVNRGTEVEGHRKSFQNASDAEGDGQSRNRLRIQSCEC